MYLQVRASLACEPLLPMAVTAWCMSLLSQIEIPLSLSYLFPCTPKQALVSPSIYEREMINLYVGRTWWDI